MVWYVCMMGEVGGDSGVRVMHEGGGGGGMVMYL
jgi:hypothetical protein